MMIVPVCLCVSKNEWRRGGEERERACFLVGERDGERERDRQDSTEEGRIDHTVVAALHIPRRSR
eukprot:EC799431.1.p5 GENE.EC799431.1~~EC799431.1.p5  ORF type:complete len:65 (+),score=17.06 EC799431.1:28-222(+)